MSPTPAAKINSADVIIITIVLDADFTMLEWLLKMYRVHT